MQTRAIAPLVRRYFASYQFGDRRAVEELLSDDFTFCSPQAERIDRCEYFARFWPNGDGIKALRIDKLFAQGNEAFVRYALERQQGCTLRNTEHFEFAQDKIRSIAVYFGLEDGQSLADEGAPDRRNRDEAAIRAVIDAITQAVREKDVDALLTHCAPEVSAFELVPPLEHSGAEALRAVWDRTLEPFEAPLECDVHDLDLTVGGDVAFGIGLKRFGGTSKDGKRSSTWLRSTLGLRKLHGEWKLVHEHVSVPFDMRTTKARLDLEP